MVTITTKHYSEKDTKETGSRISDLKEELNSILNRLNALGV